MCIALLQRIVICTFICFISAVELLRKEQKNSVQLYFRREFLSKTSNFSRTIKVCFTKVNREEKATISVSSPYQVAFSRNILTNLRGSFLKKTPQTVNLPKPLPNPPTITILPKTITKVTDKKPPEIVNGTPHARYKTVDSSYEL